MNFSLLDFLESIFFEFRYAPLIIQVAILFVFIAVTLTIFAYFSILRRRVRGSRRDQKIVRLNELIDELLIENVLSQDPESVETPGQTAEIAAQAFHLPEFSHRWGRQVLIDRLLNYRNNVRGAMGDEIRTLYLLLELDKDSLKNIKSRKWNRKVRALNELSSSEIGVADVIILPLTNSRNRELRAAARHAYIKLSKNEPFKFFDLATEPLLPWDQVELFRIITSTSHIAIPNFAQWITYSNNKSVISFCLKLVVHYNQLKAIPAVLKLLDTKDHLLRAEAINTIGKMKIVDAEDKLVYIYNNQPLNCQIEILKALGRIGSGKHTEFLKQEFMLSTDFELRKHAAKSLTNTEPPGSGLMEELMETSTPENRLILKHCMNPLIKF
ncbi:MAG: HEAT repeat domain-containing protein [Chitinophaga sp.]